MKVFYLTHAKPGFDRDGFLARWRQHGLRGIQGAHWHRTLAYVQAEPLLPAPVDGASHDYDALAYLIVRDPDGWVPSADEIASLQGMRDDEDETFARPVAETALRVEPEVLRGDGIGGVTAFLFFADVAAARRVAEHYATASDADRVVLDVVLTDGPRPTLAPLDTFGAVVEVAAYDLPRLRTLMADAARQDADLLVVAQESVLWDRRPVPE